MERDTGIRLCERGGAEAPIRWAWSVSVPSVYSLYSSYTTVSWTVNTQRVKAKCITCRAWTSVCKPGENAVIHSVVKIHFMSFSMSVCKQAAQTVAWNNKMALHIPKCKTNNDFSFWNNRWIKCGLQWIRGEAPVDKSHHSSQWLIVCCRIRWLRNNWVFRSSPDLQLSPEEELPSCGHRRAFIPQHLSIWSDLTEEQNGLQQRSISHITDFFIHNKHYYLLFQGIKLLRLVFFPQINESQSWFCNCVVLMKPGINLSITWLGVITPGHFQGASFQPLICHDTRCHSDISIHGCILWDIYAHGWDFRYCKSAFSFQRLISSSRGPI